MLNETANNFLPTYCLTQRLGSVSEAPSHIWHLTDCHRPAIALAGRPLARHRRLFVQKPLGTQFGPKLGRYFVRH
ncbi:hypothetical protein IMCC3135_19455 [Granulosicoccus antarcticus IMCC3135]|uniref:Uncharacterized protein n=1 Tax=Granulosicoccus antarcticus IMCC3135 TaxID=1192854 RepID=A0A2Z2NYP0_9GAMM|nr:hypothetical protein IMCC3135_19455 [Granulosicoccus antarcticus IMCC3135]